MAQCVKCGEELDAKAKFCLACGTPVEEKHSGDTEPPDPFKTVVKDAPVYGLVNLEQLPEGHLIDDRYEVRGKLGQGGFGAVYRVYDRKMECEKALKVLPEAVASDLESMENIRSEAVTMARLNHPNIVRIFEFQDKGAIKYIDMEFVDGMNLAEFKLKISDRKLCEEEAFLFAKGIVQGLTYAHTQGVIHKDIKPQNILISKDGTPKVTDFGISETVKSSMSRIANSSSSGTLVYMAPEQIRGRDVGRESDIYSFGALLYELLSGHPPFYKGAIEYQILSEPVPPLEGISDSLNRLVFRCLEKEYKDRFRSFDEVLAALDGKEMSKGSMPEVAPDLKDKKPGKPGWIVAAVVALLMAAAGVYGLVGKGDPTPSIEPVNFVAVTEPVVSHEPESVKIPADLPFLAEQEIKITECRGSIDELQNSMEAMKVRLDSGEVERGDSLEAMLGLIQQKRGKAIELKRLGEEKRSWAHNQLKKDIEIYTGLIAMEGGNSLKEMAWRRLVDKHPAEAKGVTAYDIGALLDGGWLTVKALPDGAQVKILNIESAYTPGMKLKPGSYEAQVGLDGYVSERVMVALTTGEDEALVVHLKPLPTLTINTTPFGADIVLKGTPLKYSHGMMLPPGAYGVVVKAKNYMSTEKRVVLKAGEKRVVSVVILLKPIISTLTINTTPSGADIVLTGTSLKYVPGVQLPPGEYGMMVTAKNYVSFKRNLVLRAGEKEALSVKLTPYGRLTVETKPSNAKVEIKGLRQRYVSGMYLKPGLYGVVVSKRGLFSHNMNVEVKAGQTVKAKVVLSNKNSIGMEFVYIEPGSFTMGSPSSRNNDEIQHRVILSQGYYLQTTEVTQGQWRAVMGNNPSRFSNCGDECPVEKVSWKDAQKFIQKLNALEGGSRYRLPTEAQWEFGCRAGSNTPYANRKNLSSQGWYDNNSGGKVHRVAQKRANAWGLYDMHGNVYEFCQDWYGDYSTGDVVDPVGPSSGSFRVIRGGSWKNGAHGCRSANRSNDSLGLRNDSLGFRLARRGR